MSTNRWIAAIEANLFSLLNNYPDLSLGDINIRIKNIANCIEGIIDDKINSIEKKAPCKDTGQSVK